MNLMSIASKISAAALLATLAIPLTQLGDADAGSRERSGLVSMVEAAKGAIEAVRSVVSAEREIDR